jgi:hypothetical protein
MFKKKIQNVRYRKLVIATVLRWLSYGGIKIVPYNLYMESNNYLNSANFMERFKKICELIIISADDIDSLAEIDCLAEFKKKLLTLLDGGNSCMYVLSRGQVIGYCWFNLKYCAYDYFSFTLQDDEAYAFNFWTSKNSRWVAMFLAISVYDHLRSLDKNRIYSVTEIFNTPAMNLRKKLHSRLCRRYVYINLFNLFRKNIELERPGDDDVHF